MSSEVLSKPTDITNDCLLLKFNLLDGIIFFSFNVGNRHWVLFDCDFSSLKITYYDPLKEKMPSSLMKNLSDFIQVINRSNSQLVDFKKIKFSVPAVCDI